MIMPKHVDLSDLERGIRARYHNDGIALIVAGLSLIFLAVFFYDHRQAWATTFAVGVWAWLAESLRRRLIYPRLGYAKLPAKQNPLTVLLAIGAVVSVFVGAMFVAKLGIWFVGPIYWGTVLAAAALVIAVASGSRIAYALAPLFLLSGVGGATLAWLGVCCAESYQLAALGSILVAIGGGQLILLRRRYPEPTSEALDGRD
jgi:hypothetical protein